MLLILENKKVLEPTYQYIVFFFDIIPGNVKIA